MAVTTIDSLRKVLESTAQAVNKRHDAVRAEADRSVQRTTAQPSDTGAAGQGG